MKLDKAIKIGDDMIRIIPEGVTRVRINDKEVLYESQSKDNGLLRCASLFFSINGTEIENPVILDDICPDNKYTSAGESKTL